LYLNFRLDSFVYVYNRLINVGSILLIKSRCNSTTDKHHSMRICSFTYLYGNMVYLNITCFPPETIEHNCS